MLYGAYNISGFGLNKPWLIMKVFFPYARGVVLPDIKIFYVDTANYLNSQWFIRRLNPVSGRHNLEQARLSLQRIL